MKIDSIADLKRIPKDTILRLTKNGRGPVKNGLRIFKEARRDEVVLTIADRDSPYYGRDAHLVLYRCKVKGTTKGFNLLSKVDGSILCSYEVLDQKVEDDAHPE